MKKSLIAGLVLVVLVLVVFISRGRKEDNTLLPTERAVSDRPSSETSGTASTESESKTASQPKVSKVPVQPGKVAEEKSSAPATGSAASVPTDGKTSGTPSAQASGKPVGSAETPLSGAAATTAQKKADAKDGVDGDFGAQGDDGDFPPPQAQKPQTLAGVPKPSVWLAAADLRDLKSVPSGNKPVEIGYPDGSKATPWKSRSGIKSSDAIRVRGSTSGTFIRGLTTSVGMMDAVALCAPSARDCQGSQPTQLKLGPDMNHREHWLSGPDKKGNSAKGGGSFTLLYVAARASSSPNPLVEHSNGESGATKSVFLGWIGPDLVGSIHGFQGVVGTSAVKIPSTWTSGVTPEIYTLRFDRKKSELKVFALGEKGSDAAELKLPAGEGPDNDEYAPLAMGSKNPGTGSVTYVMEQAAYSRALTDAELCSIHKEWNKKYQLKISKLKPCE